MELSSKTAGAIISPVQEKTAQLSRSKSYEKHSENFHPNVSSSGFKCSNSPSTSKFGKSAKKSALKSTSRNQVASPPIKKKIRERKFVIVKKKLRNDEVNSPIDAVACEKCKKQVGISKCLCVAYETLRTSQEEFFKNFGGINDDVDFDKLNERDNGAEIAKPSEGKMEKTDYNRDDRNEVEGNGEINLKRNRERLLEEARETGPEPGSGRVKHLIQAFENLQFKSGETEDNEQEVNEDKKGMKWALPGLQQPSKVSDLHVSSSSFCPSDFFLTSESLGLDSRRSYSLDSSQGSISIRTSGGGQKSRRNSSESSGTFARRQWKKKQREATSQKPFMLRTEQRGKSKEEEFMRKLQQMVEEEEKLRIPIAQRLPLTTDEPECLVKPPVKEITRPIDLVLHTDIRAVERGEFDHLVAEKMNLIEQYRMERERQQKLAEEEEIKRLRKELVPKAQPMPYFDRPFIPRRSSKHPTVPKEPKLHIPQHKKIKCCTSLDEFCPQQH